MLFNSLHFALFLPVVFALYWALNNKLIKYQNALLLIASYFFYACWDWRFMFLLLFSTLLDYFTGIKMAESTSPQNKKRWFWLSIGINLGFLGVFKYYNFFADSFAQALTNIGLEVNPTSLNVILPVGISFYTFHGLSYVIDIYKEKIKPENNFIDYAVFVSFFPLLVAGPIERATHLLPQLKQQRKFDYVMAVDGMRQILWGLFKKIVIADQCAVFANMIFNNSDAYPGSTLLLGAIFFAFQIYGDFSGYSDIAIGTAKLFGINLLRNFAYPYFSRDIAEFWRRWHISLSSWFRDYLYIPLGGSRQNMAIKIRNTFIIFIVSGFWHGANWTFIVWGAINALFILPSIIRKTNRSNLGIVADGKVLPSLKDTFAMLSTFAITVFAWIFFRAENLAHAGNYISEIFSRSLFTGSAVTRTGEFLTAGLLILFFIGIEWSGRSHKYAIENIVKYKKRTVRWAIYAGILFLIVMYMPAKSTPFIYFQF
jgi:alginate O-acetyltransferase complex protein AlgI